MATITAVPPYFGTVLQNGSRGPDSAQVQTWLNGIRKQWPQIQSVTVDGRYGGATVQAVKQFQTMAGLTVDGMTGQSTWNALYTQYAGIYGAGEIYPGIVAAPGARGAVVKSMQQKLLALSKVYTGIQTIATDGSFGSGTSAALRRFQPQFGLTADALLGKNTFAGLAKVYEAVRAGNPPKVVTRYAGYVMQQGSRGDWVRFLQSYLNGVSGLPQLTVDGNFGSGTKKSVVAFQGQQGLTADGKVGTATWSRLITVFNQQLG